MNRRNHVTGIGHLAAAVISITQLSAQSIPGPEWRQFRGPNGQGSSRSSGLPISWSASQNLAWKTLMPGPGGSSPIVAGDRIYITAYSGYAVPGATGGDLANLQRHVLGIRRVDGTILWKKELMASQPEQANVRDHGYASSTPIADAGRLYVFFGRSGVFAFDHDGQQVWHADVGSKIHGWGSASSPLLYQDLVIINAAVESDSLVALNKTTGKEVWRAEGIKESWNTPILADGKLYGLDRHGTGFVLAVQPQFKLLARNELVDRGSFDASPAVDGNRLLIRSDKYLYCLAAR